MAAAVREQPDVCLVDIRMPGGGLAAVWEIGARLPDTRIVMLTVSESDGDLLAALRAGASGYLLKTMSFERLPHALHGAVVGEAPIPRRLVTRLVESFHSPLPRRRVLVPEQAEHHLTSREWEILELLAAGLATRQIARRLSLSPSAIRSHVASVVHKLGVRDREAAIELFRRGR